MNEIDEAELAAAIATYPCETCGRPLGNRVLIINRKNYHPTDDCRPPETAFEQRARRLARKAVRKLGFDV